MKAHNFKYLSASDFTILNNWISVLIHYNVWAALGACFEEFGGSPEEFKRTTILTCLMYMVAVTTQFKLLSQQINTPGKTGLNSVTAACLPDLQNTCHITTQRDVPFFFIILSALCEKYWACEIAKCDFFKRFFNFIDFHKILQQSWH